ncbi:MAG TPA: ATP-dependent protease subunit HslV [candidate division Zixibacteria bacterium]|jgi:ATP-dependent HslUV protease subunit HslV|nr:ATP-dependent protease subunit HslV [Candidatus Latescibacterota bacterium]HIG48486.1 ATP-dependent protease subunit HslV [candidate division Zixibacteria bacterium]
MTPIRSTTILGVRDDKKVVLGGDGQVSLGDTVMKQSANKIRRMYDDRILAGFAGAAADGLTLFTLFESQLDEYRGNLVRAVVEFTKDWRSDRYLRQLEALLVVMDTQYSFVVSGNGDIIEPDDGITAIGSGGPYALAAARGLITHSELDARQIVKASLSIAASICVYTNDQLTIEELSI